MKSNFKMTDDFKARLDVFANTCKTVDDAMNTLPELLNIAADIQNGDVIVQRIMHGRQMYLNQLMNPQALTETLGGMKISSAKRVENKRKLLKTMMDSIEYLTDPNADEDAMRAVLTAQEGWENGMSEKKLDACLNQLHDVMAKLTAARILPLPDDQTLPDKVIIREDDVSALCAGVAVYVQQMNGDVPFKNGELTPEEIGIEVTFRQQALAIQAAYALHPSAREELADKMISACHALIYIVMYTSCLIGSAILLFYCMGCESVVLGILGLLVMTGISGSVTSDAVINFVDPALKAGATLTSKGLCAAAEGLCTFIGETIVPGALTVYEKVCAAVKEASAVAAEWVKDRFAELSVTIRKDIITKTNHANNPA